MPGFEFCEALDAAVTISYYPSCSRFPDIIQALVSGGYRDVEHHIWSTEPTPSGPNRDRYRFAANELCHASLHLTVLYCDETCSTDPEGERRADAPLLVP